MTAPPDDDSLQPKPGVDDTDGASTASEEASGGSEGDLNTQLARAEEERDTALAALHTQERGDRRKNRIRRTAAAVLVILFSVVLSLTYVVTWTHNVVLTTSGFNRTVDPIAADPQVTAAAATLITNQIYEALQPQQVVANALPPNAAFLAGPVTNAAKGYVQTAVTNVLQSSQFQNLWKQAIQFAHSQLLAVLNGNSKVVTTTNGQVVLDLVPLLNAALQNLSGFVSGVTGHPVTLPTVTSSDVPSDACARIGAALNRTLPATCGQIPLFPADRLDQARRTVRIFNGVTLLLLIITPLLAALALWISPRRRRTLLQLCVGGFLGLVVIRRTVIWLESALEKAGVPENRDARHAILSHLFHNYFSVSRWLLVGILVLFLGTLVTGPYPWAVALRSKTGDVGRQGYEFVLSSTRPTADNAAVTWVRAHLDLLRVIGVVLAVVILLAASVSWIGLLVIAVLLALYEYWLYRIGRSAPLSMAPPDPGATEPSPNEQPGPPASGPAHAV